MSSIPVLQFSILMKQRLFEIFAATFLTVAISCGGPSERIRESPTKSPTPAQPQTEREISGVFNVTGAGDNGVDAYKGILTIANQGDVYTFRWSTNRGSRVGNGVQLGNLTAASYAATGAGKGCGVVLYKIASDGSLDGRVALWGGDKFGSEKATRDGEHGFVGKYTIVGNSVDGKSYAGRLTITKDGAGYDFEWVHDFEWDPDKMFVGFGVWKGSVAAVSFGGRQCSFALYDIQSNGNLEGDWGGQKAVTFGTETAKRE